MCEQTDATVQLLPQDQIPLHSSTPGQFALARNAVLDDFIDESNRLEIDDRAGRGINLLSAIYRLVCGGTEMRLFPRIELLSLSNHHSVSKLSERMCLVRREEKPLTEAQLRAPFLALSGMHAFFFLICSLLSVNAVALLDELSRTLLGLASARYV